jgi:hypothetical protein
MTHPHSRWNDGRRWQIIIAIATLIGTGALGVVYNFIRSTDETHIVNTVTASPVIDAHTRDIVRTENAELVKSINFVIALNYQHMTAAEIERAKGVSGLVVVNKGN